MTIAPPPASTPLPAPASFNAKQLAIGFYIDWDESSYSSLERNLNSLDWVVPQWTHLVNTKPTDRPIQDELDNRQARMALNLIRERRPQISIIPMVQNLSDEKWETELLTRSVGDEDSRQRLIAALAQFVEQNKFAGICVDFEEVAKEAQPNLLRFMQELHAAFQTHAWVVMQAVPFDDENWNYREYAAATDYLVLMAYDQHYGNKDFGSIAAQGWYESLLAKRMGELNPMKTIIALGSYGYDWPEGKNPNEVSFQEAVIHAQESEAKIEFDPVTRNPHYDFYESDESHHIVWFLDG